MLKRVMIKLFVIKSVVFCVFSLLKIVCFKFLVLMSVLILVIVINIIIVIFKFIKIWGIVSKNCILKNNFLGLYFSLIVVLITSFFTFFKVL